MHAGSVADQSTRHHTIKGLIPAALAVTEKEDNKKLLCWTLLNIIADLRSHTIGVIYSKKVL